MSSPLFCKYPSQTTISKEELLELDLIRYEGPIFLIQNDEDALQAIEELQKEKVLGFDTETRPAFRKGQSFLPSIIQLAGEKTVYLFQLQHLTLLPKLFTLLENPSLLKTGVALAQDLKKLNELHPFTPAGFIDLSRVASKIGFEKVGLRNLTALLMKKRISKSAQTSKWSNPELTEAQINYAATDAWISRQLYFKLLEFFNNEKDLVTLFEKNTKSNASK